MSNAGRKSARFSESPVVVELRESKMSGREESMTEVVSRNTAANAKLLNSDLSSSRESKFGLSMYQVDGSSRPSEFAPRVSVFIDESGKQDETEIADHSRLSIVPFANARASTVRRPSVPLTLEAAKEAAKAEPPPPPPPPAWLPYYEAFLIFCGIATMAMIGAYIRIGIDYYKIWLIESNYCVMYTNVIGCIIMGIVAQHRKYLFDRCQSRFHKVLFISLSTGLCGSITTFSTWSVQCNKSFYLQWDTSWGNCYGSTNGGRLFQWFLCMFEGVVVPMIGIHIGNHIGMLSEYSNDRLTDFMIAPVDNPYSEVFVMVAFFTAITLVVVIPALAYPTWIFITFTGIFATIGAYTRFKLSPYNTVNKEFPLGTFAANILGTWVYGIMMVVSRMGVNYYDYITQSVILGVIEGFCGCCTTVSTFVTEIDKLPVKNSYIYGITTNLVAQFGLILLVNVPFYLSVPSSAVMPSPINMCSTTSATCEVLLDYIGCPSVERTSNICLDSSSPDYNTFIGDCSCGDLYLTHIMDIQVDAQVNSNVSRSLSHVWPRNSSSSYKPAEVIDPCLSYADLCDHFLNRIGCPYSDRTVNACDRKGILNYQGSCSCGSYRFSNDRILFDIVHHLLTTSNDLVPYVGYASQTPMTPPVDFAGGYDQVCSSVLNHVQCPTKHRTVIGVPDGYNGNYSYWDGSCLCGTQFDVSHALTSTLFEALVSPTYRANIVINPNTNTTFDVMTSFELICDSFLTRIGCPISYRNVTACTSLNGMNNNNNNCDFSDFVGICSCGRLHVGTDVVNVITSGLTEEYMYNSYFYFSAPVPAYTTTIGSDAFEQLKEPLSP